MLRPCACVRPDIMPNPDLTAWPATDASSGSRRNSRIEKRELGAQPLACQTLAGKFLKCNHQTNQYFVGGFLWECDSFGADLARNGASSLKYINKVSLK